MQLLLPTEDANKLGWQDFRHAISQLGLDLEVIEQSYGGNVLVEVNASREDLEQEVIALMNLCFAKYHLA